MNNAQLGHSCSDNLLPLSNRWLCFRPGYRTSGFHQMTELLKLHTDELGLIVQLDGDGGDCAARTGETVIALKRNKQKVEVQGEAYGALDIYLHTTAHLEQQPNGILIRYPRPPYTDPHDVPGDQTIPLVIAAGYIGDLGFVRRSHQTTLALGFIPRFQNGDLLGPAEMTCYFRSYRMSGRRVPTLLMYGGDLFLLCNTLVQVIRTSLNQDEVGDWIRLVQQLVQAYDCKPTLFSWLARKIANLVRGGVQRTFDHYHRKESGGNEAIAQLWEPIIKEVFGT